jgi:hypothetical protein
MKNVTLFCLSIFFTTGLMAKSPFVQSNDSLPKFYLGLGTGINNYTGLLGIGADISIHNNFMLKLGGGIGAWGTKLSAGIKYVKRDADGWGVGVSYSICSGVKNVKLNLETSAETKDVTMNLSTASTLNLTASYNWVYSNHNRMFLELGYAVPFENNPYKITDGSILSTNGKNAMHFIQPGGIIFGFGFMFAL